jgi:GDP-L-fucose synthase
MTVLADKKILVTGGSGFVGRHLVAHLRGAGCRALITPRSHEFDLTIQTETIRLLEVHRPEIVIHLAARVGGIGANRKRPGTFLYDNLVMGAHLIEASRRAGIEKFVHIGTVCSYPKFAAVPFREETIWDGYPEETNAPYGLAKKLLGEQLRAYAAEFGFRSAELLLVNLYGPGDNFDPESSHVIPALIRKFSEARQRDLPSVTLWGTGQASREFVYVEDAVRAIALAAERLDVPDPVNVGSGNEIRIADLASLIAGVIGFRGEIRFDPSMPDGQPRRRLDVSRAEARLGFRATTSFAEGLERTIAWYRQQPSGS